jgi:hypothetical protein
VGNKREQVSGRGRGGSQIIRRHQSLVLYKSSILSVSNHLRLSRCSVSKLLRLVVFVSKVAYIQITEQTGWEEGREERGATPLTCCVG